MAMTKVRQHQFMKMTVVHIDVLPDEEGKPVVFIDPDKAAAAEQTAVYGCYACDVPLSEGFGTECTGESDADIPPLP